MLARPKVERVCGNCGWRAERIFDYCPRCHAPLPRTETPASGLAIPPLGAYLVRRGVATEEQLARAVARQQALARKGKQSRLGDILVELGIASRAQVEAALAEQRDEFARAFGG